MKADLQLLPCSSLSIEMMGRKLGFITATEPLFCVFQRDQDGNATVSIASKSMVEHALKAFERGPEFSLDEIGPPPNIEVTFTSRG